MKAALVKRLNIVAWLALIALIIGQTVGYFHWFAELFSHFVPHYAAVFLLAAVFTCNKKRWFWLVCAVLTLAWIIRLPENSNQKTNNKTETWQLIWYNVNLHNAQPEQETAKILAKQPNIAALAEIDLNPRWQPLKHALPHGCEYRSSSPFALVMWSKTPFQACEVKMIDDYPYIRAEQAGRVVYALHPPPPITAQLAQSRTRYLTQVAEKISLENKVLVVGDLNSSPFSPLFRQFVQRANLSPQTPAWLPTWKLLGLNIDHVLAREKVKVQTLEWGESDHRGLFIE
ncbi:endonuclease/exonuclease/phosphatase family protein [Neisseriaceae bacterium B1]